MKKEKRKAWTSVAALGMAGILALLTVYHTVSITALAKETLPGVEKIIKKNAPNAPFKILEIVPEAGAGEIGLYIKGQEGFSLSEDLKKLPTKAERAAYIANLTARLKEISSSPTVPNAADTTPLLYETYREEYFPEPVTGWNRVELADGKSETVRMNGQYVIASGAKGNYTQIPAAYVPVAEGSGTHRENISGFTLPSDGNPTPYAVTFAATLPTDPKLLSLGAYESVYGMLEEESVTSLDAKTPIFLYQKDTDTYIAHGTVADCRPAGPGEPPKLHINMGDYYYVAGYQYVDPVNMQPSITYYYVETYSFEYHVGTGQYNSAAKYQAIIKPGEERYSPAPPSDPTNPTKKSDANFKSTGVTYEYTPDTGNYNFEQKAGTDLPVEVQVESFYYQGGYTNHEWFKRYILDLDPADLEAFKMEVTTVKPNQLHEKMYRMVDGREVLQSYDLIYLSGKSRTPGITYGVGNDSSVADADTLLGVIARERVPLIVDWQSLFRTDGSLNTGGRLAMLGLIALQPDLPSLVTNRKLSVGKLDETTLDDLWNHRVGSRYEKNHLVNQNVYCFDRSHGGDLVQNNLCAAITDRNVEEAFQSVKAVLHSENAYRANVEGKELLDETISKAAAIRHILNYKYGRNTTPKSALRILEIEPCASYKVNEKEILTAEKVLGWMGMDQPTAELRRNTVIDRMTTAEFIGKIDDLNGKYDMIYIGMNTAWMNTDAKGETQYNDSNMNGLVYANAGDVTLEQSILLGQLYHDYVNTNPTTDWTSEQVKALERRYLFPTRVGEIGALRTRMVDGQLVYQEDPRRMKIRNIGDDGEYRTLPDTVTYPKNTGIFRYPGNDITKEVRDKLLNYADAGYPIVFGDGFMSDTTSTPMVVNEHKIDNSSYLYEFAQTALDRAKTAKRENLLTENQLTEEGSLGVDFKKRELFAFYMNIAKPKLNVEMTGGHVGSGAEEQSKLYYLDADRGEYYLRYQFSITDEASLSPETTTYNCKLYLDINADGQFADARGSTEANAKTEELSDVLIRKVDTDSRMLPDEYGAYELSAGVSYQLERIVPKGFHGALPWKLEILRNDMGQTGIVAQRHAPIRGAASGYACIRETTEKPKIFVLQIYHTQDAHEPTFYLGRDPKQKTAATDAFWQYIEEANLEFDIEIEACNTKEYEKKYQAAKADVQDMLAEKDMLIIGFADMFSEIDNQDGAVDGILDFIKTGKSVLFAHDTTSFVNTPPAQRAMNDVSGFLEGTGGGNWGYNFNMKIRDIVGMDRYGISNTELSGLREGKILNPKDPDKAGLWKKIDILEKDKAYVARSKRKQTYPEVQGYTYQVLNNYKRKGEFLKYLNLSADSGLTIGGNGSYYGEGEQMHVTQVNAGQITTYPFKIPERFPVSLTHSQYYQLDLNTDADRDGKSDLVVWYCLGDVTNKAGLMKTPYSASPNDVRNNYYIYSNRNVMYTGVGHSEVEAEREFEIKLFINTIVAAYHTGVSAPRISIIENSDIRSAEVDHQYLIYEYGPTGDAETIEGLDSSLDIYYKVADDNLVGEEKRMEVQYEYLDDTGKPEENRLFGCKTYSMTTGEEVSASETLQGSRVYKVTLPDIGALLGTKPNFQIRITVTSRFNNYGDPVSASASDVVTISRSDLFDLE